MNQRLKKKMLRFSQILPLCLLYSWEYDKRVLQIPPAIRRPPSVRRGTLLCRQAVRLQLIAELAAPWQG